MSWAAFVIKDPQATKVSLLARPIVFCARIAAMVGSMPAAPTTAVTTIIASGKVAATDKASLPPTISVGPS